MRKAVIILTAIAFFACLLIGIAISETPLLEQLISATPAAAENVQPASSTNQQNILLVHVDQLENGQPQLRSVWAVFIFLQEPSSMMFAPLYPMGSEDYQQRLRESFAVSSDGALQPGLLALIEQDIQIKFDNYVLVDNDGILSSASWFSAFTNGTGLALTAAPDTASLDAESEFFSAVCQYIPQAKNEGAPAFPWQNLFPEHAATNLAFQTAITNWKTLIEKGDPVNCEVINHR